MARIRAAGLITVLQVGCLSLAPALSAAEDIPAAPPSQPARVPVELQLAPSGEALWDVYAGQLLLELHLHVTDELVPHDRAALLALLGQSEEFGDQAGYWELLCFEAQRQELGDEYVGGLIRTAHEAGISSAPLLWCDYLLTTRRLLGRIEVPIEKASGGGLGMGGSAAPPKQPTYESTPLWILQTNEATVTRLNLLSSLIAQFPEYSVPYYERALLRCNEADYAAALQDFASGNAARINAAPRLFPLGFAQYRLGSDRPLGNAAVEGLVLEAGETILPRPSAMWLDDIREQSLALQVRVGLHGRPDEIVAFSQFLVRLGTLDGRDNLDSVVACNYAVRNLRFLLEDLGDSFGPAEHGMLERAIRNWLLVPAEVENWRLAVPDEASATAEVISVLQLGPALARYRAQQHGDQTQPDEAPDSASLALAAALHYKYLALVAENNRDLQTQVIDPLLLEVTALDWAALVEAH